MAIVIGVSSFLNIFSRSNIINLGVEDVVSSNILAIMNSLHRSQKERQRRRLGSVIASRLDLRRFRLGPIDESKLDLRRRRLGPIH